MGGGFAGVRGRLFAGALRTGTKGLGTRDSEVSRLSQYLFIYGTLRPGLAPDAVEGAVSTLRLVGEGFVRGTLYDLGEYPGAVLNVASSNKIFGMVFELPGDAGVLRALDVYEGFNPDVVSESLFVRVEQVVELEDGSAVPCWVYVYNLDPVGARVVAGGRYCRARES